MLALAVNTEGFIRYSFILAGNTADPSALPHMVENIIAKNPVPSNPDEKVLVVIDASIATEDNLRLLRESGYNYLCVSRTKPADCTLACDGRSVTVLDSRRRPITLAQVAHEEGGDYYLRVNSPSKAMTERSRNRQWRERFEAELQKARDALSRKGGTKSYDKVVERGRRARGRYPSVSKYYQIEYVRCERNPQHMADIRWRIAISDDEAEQRFGTYFLRTNVPKLDEKTTWEYYNLIREIDASNRQLKLDRELRHIYHQKDDSSDAHLFFGMLSYWIVNTIRHKLKQHCINHYWTELKRIPTPRRPSPPRPTTHWESPSSSGSALTPPTEPPKSTAPWATTPSRSIGTPSKRPRHRPMAKSVVPTAKSRKMKRLQDSQIAISPR